jgi:hypothetical protein
VVGSLVLEDKALVAGDSLENGRLLDIPSSNILPLLFSVLLFGVRWLPPGIPAICELLEERCFEGRRLLHTSQHLPILVLCAENAIAEVDPAKVQIWPE